MYDIEKTIKHFESLQKRYITEHNGKMCERVADALEALKNYTTYVKLLFAEHTVDAVPVVHGHWKLNRNCSAKSYYCSVCLEGESDYGTDNYCPNCGAKMDEVVE